MNQDSSSSTPAGHTRIRYKLHWHVLLIHFPISFFLGAFVFMAMHLVSGNDCYSLAAYMSLIFGAVSMIPVTYTGWTTWKSRYRGVKGKLFIRKIRISFGMITISFLLVIYQTVSDIETLHVFNNLGHFLYFNGVILLVLGAAGEGYYGGRLHHK